MDPLSRLALAAVAALLIARAFEARSRSYFLAIAIAGAPGSAYGLPQRARPFGRVEAARAAIALARWRRRKRAVAASA